MRISVNLLTFIVGIQVITSQDSTDEKPRNVLKDIPADCWGPRPGAINISQCCPLERIDTEQELKRCEFDKPLPFQKSPCSRYLCLLRNKGVLNDDDTINYKKLITYIGKWAEKQPHIEQAAKIAVGVCFGLRSGPREPFVMVPDPNCEPDKFYKCFIGTILWHCKLSEEPRCQALKNHMDKCRKYLQ